jgi:hypothetical protein
MVLTVILVAVSFLFPSNPSQWQVIAEEPSSLKVVHWTDSDSCCLAEYRDGVRFKVIGEGEISIATSMMDKYGKTGVGVGIWLDKNAHNRIEISPESVKLFEVSGSSLREVKREDPGKMAHSAEKRAAIASGLGTFGANMQTQTTTGTTSSGDTVTVRSPDYGAQRRAQENAKVEQQAAQDFGLAVVQSALKKNTINPGGNVIGWVYFSHQKKGLLLLRINVDDLVFEIPFDAKTKE